LYVAGVRKKDAIVTEDNMTNGNRSQRARNPSPVFVIGGIVLALAGFVVGRAHPAHNYQLIGTSSYLYDTHTGKLCAPFRDSELAELAAAKGTAQLGSPLADAVQESWDKLHPKTALELIPSCGSE
jgi:hypothetical protein